VGIRRCGKASVKEREVLNGEGERVKGYSGSRKSGRLGAQVITGSYYENRLWTKKSGKMGGGKSYSNLETRGLEGNEAYYVYYILSVIWGKKTFGFGKNS